MLRRFACWKLTKPDKGLLRCYLERTTGLSQSQLTRLIQRYLAEGQLADRRQGAAKPFRRKYTRADIELLAEADELHGTLSGPATLALLERAWEVFGDARFERLAGLSNGHLYNLRRSHTYVQRLGAQHNTRPARISIAERRRPQPEGRPGTMWTSDRRQRQVAMGRTSALTFLGSPMFGDDPDEGTGLCASSRPSSVLRGV